MKTLFLAGASGLVGQHVLRAAYDDSRIQRVIAPTRRPLQRHSKLDNLVVDFEQLEDLPSTTWQADAAICTLGTTRKKAGSNSRFREIDLEIPLQLARKLHLAGCPTFVLLTSLGSNPNARSLYPRVKGELEAAIAKIDFPRCTIVRPSLLGGARSESRPAEALAKFVFKLLGPLIPSRYQLVEPDLLARCLLQQAKSSQSGHQVIESENIQVFDTWRVTEK